MNPPNTTPLNEEDRLGEILSHDYLKDRCDLHEKYTSACCGCQKARAVYEFVEMTKEIAKQELTNLIQTLEKKARKAGEKAGRSDELVKLYEWGKTIDDQWNKHFEERLAELGERGTAPNNTTTRSKE